MIDNGEKAVNAFVPRMKKAWGNFRDILYIFTFNIPARSKEHCVNMESKNPKRGTVVVDILGR